MLAVEGVVDVGRLLMEEQVPYEEARIREGVDFVSQEGARWRPGTPVLERRIDGACLRLVCTILEEISLVAHTGQLPGGVPWSEQPAWRVKLWEHVWEILRSEDLLQ